jgi:hypothetical protein
VLDYAWRIQHEDLPPTGRSDVPDSLEGVLGTAMSRSPQGRYTSALSFARALQKAERELGLEVSTVDVLDDGFSSPDGADIAGLRLRPVAPAEPAPPAAPEEVATMAASRVTLAVRQPAAATTAVAVGSDAAAPPEGMPADITLVMARGAEEPPAADPIDPAAADAPDPVDAVEALEADLLLADAAPPPPERRAVWPAVLIDLTLLAAVAAAGAVYLLLLH